jgi:hypothetical protein
MGTGTPIRFLPKNLKYHLERAPAVLTLTHELGHFVQHEEMIDTLGPVKTKANFRSQQMIDDRLDPECLERFEGPMANFLGVKRRLKYNDTNFKVKSNLRSERMQMLTGGEATRVRKQHSPHLPTWLKGQGARGQQILKACKQMAGPFDKRDPDAPLERCLAGGYYQIPRFFRPYVYSART